MTNSPLVLCVMSIDTSLSIFRRPGQPERRAAGLLSALGLGAMALLHVLVALSFLVALAVASGRAHAGDEVPPPAQTAMGDPASCGGHDLLAEMAKTNPEKLATIRRQAAATPNGASRFWKVEKAGVKPSWLYGTMHVSDPRVLDLPPKAAEALHESGTVVIETADLLDPAKAQAEILSKPELTMFTDGKTLADFLSPADLSLLKKGLRKRGLSFQLVSHMKPWMLASLVALPACEAARKQAGDDILDKKIAEDAKAAGKTVEGLETLNEQLQAMAGLPIAFHMRGLIETLELGRLMDDVTATMTDLYLQGKIGTIMPVMQAVSPKKDAAEESGYAAFQQRIITDRNAVMAKRAAPIIDKGNAFIAIGALHLPGAQGVVARLRKSGYTVTAVE